MAPQNYGDRRVEGQGSDRDDRRGLRGVVTKVEWTNPHARFYVDVKDDKGNVAS